MSTVKFFEIRDSMTTLPLMATKIEPINSEEDWLIRRAMGDFPYPLFLITFMAKDESRFDVYGWGQVGARTVKEAHNYIEKNWDTLSTGDVIDIEFILGEKPTQKQSENPHKLKRE